MKSVYFTIAVVLLGGCHRSESTALLGTLEWDRIGVMAESSEPIIAIDVVEGQQVSAGAALLHMDPRRADAAVAQAEAQVQRTEAALNELLAGTRSETIDQARAMAADARAALDMARIARERMDVRAMQDGRVDALPFKLGDQPPQGATVVSLLAGTMPYARLFVPASRRAAMADGMSCTVQVQGIDASYAAKVRSVRSDPAFTPYYALTGDDASRLAYRAELVLLDDAAKKLPAGLPLQADCDAP